MSINDLDKCCKNCRWFYTGFCNCNDKALSIETNDVLSILYFSEEGYLDEYIKENDYVYEIVKNLIKILKAQDVINVPLDLEKLTEDSFADISNCLDSFVTNVESEVYSKANNIKNEQIIISDPDNFYCKYYE